MLQSIFSIIILIISVVVHEVAHGFVALRYGDHTAEHAGRLTLNPLKHLDPMGSIVIPLVLIVTNAPFMIGWAKPVPYNEHNLSDLRKGTRAVASAGIIVNLSIALLFGLFIRAGFYYGFMNQQLFFITQTIVVINIVLGVFNLIPIPPLDGSKILFSFLPSRFLSIQRSFEKYSIIFLLIFVFFLWNLLSPIIVWLFTLMTGVN